LEVQPDPEGLDRLFVKAPEYDAEFEVFGKCPVQALGSVHGRDLYFRARHHHWSFDVADSAGNLPSDGYRDSDGFFREGKSHNSGWMTLQEAIAIIEQCLREYAVS
jgi:hypothetical protein